MQLMVVDAVCVSPFKQENKGDQRRPSPVQRCRPSNAVDTHTGQRLNTIGYKSMIHLNGITFGLESFLKTIVTENKHS